MCWAFRAATGGIEAAAYGLAILRTGRIVRSGQEAVVLTRRTGGYAWMASRYGMSFPKTTGGRQLIWNARDDRLEEIEVWARLRRQRMAVAVDAYVESAPHETWRVGPTAWMVGFYNTDRDGGSVTLTEGSADGRRPVLVDEAGARAWLEAEPWDAKATLGRAARIAYGEADLFEAKRLSTDARTAVPLPRAA